MTTAPRRLDLTPLTAPVDRADVARHREQTLERFPTARWRAWTPQLSMRWAFVVFALFGAAGLTLVLQSLIQRVMFFWLHLERAAPLIVAIGLAAIPFVWALGRALRETTRRLRVGAGFAEHQYRLDAFARANGMAFTPVRERPGLPGLLFREGSDRRALSIVSATTPRRVEIGEYSYGDPHVEVSGIEGIKKPVVREWTYVALHVGTEMPHLILDARGNDSVLGTSLPGQFSRHLRLRLEGDFNRWFTLYAPAGSERDALYLFTPDVMALLVDHAHLLDVEVAGEWLLFYARADHARLSPDDWARRFALVDAFAAKLDQWQRWRRDPSSAPAGADGSARLMPRTPWRYLLPAAVFIALWLAIVIPIGVSLAR